MVAIRSALALTILAGYAFSEGVTSVTAPPSGPPAGCANSRSGSFGIAPVNFSTTTGQHSKREYQSLSPRQTESPEMTLDGGVLREQGGPIAYISAGHQIAFDSSTPTDAIYTAGWSICANGSLALGNSTIFYGCPIDGGIEVCNVALDASCYPMNIVSLQGAGSIFTTSLSQVSTKTVSSAQSSGSTSAKATSGFAITSSVDTHSAASPTTLTPIGVAGVPGGETMNDLTGGEVAGIVIGSIVGALLLAIAAFWAAICLRHRRHTAIPNNAEDQMSPGYSPAAAFNVGPGQGFGIEADRATVSYYDPPMSSVQSRPVELSGDTTRDTAMK